MCRNGNGSQALLQDADDIANAWYTGNKWPRVTVSYTKLFLPTFHLAVALCFTAEHIFGQLSLSELKTTAMDSVERAGAPVSKWVSRGTVQTIMVFVGVRLPDVLQEYTFYIVLVPVFAFMLVRHMRGCAPVIGRCIGGCLEICAVRAMAAELCHLLALLVALMRMHVDASKTKLPSMC